MTNVTPVKRQCGLAGAAVTSPVAHEEHSEEKAKRKELMPNVLNQLPRRAIGRRWPIGISPWHVGHTDRRPANAQFQRAILAKSLDKFDLHAATGNAQISKHSHAS